MRQRATRFVRAARRVADALGPQDCLVAGGLAVMAHGFVRATRDVDLLTRVPLRDARLRLGRVGLTTDLQRGDAMEGGFTCLKGTCDGVPFDVLPELVPIHWERAPLVWGLATSGLRAVPLEDLLALKLKAQGAKDLMDAAMLVLLHPETKTRARELAVAYRALDRFDMWLEDPRLHEQAAEEAERGRRAARAPAADAPRRRTSSAEPRRRRPRKQGAGRRSRNR